MKFLIVLTLLFSGTSYAQKVDYSNHHIVFDLDWTLLYQLKEGDIVTDESKVIEFEGQRFRITDHAGELIQSLLENYKGVNISFYSGGSEERNRKVLGAIKLPNGQTASDIYTDLFSRQDLEVVSESKELGFAERNKKVLYDKIDYYDGAKVLLIDDLLQFSDYRGTRFEIKDIKQRLNTLFSFGRISFYEKKSDLLKQAPKLHDPTDEKHWFLERNKTAIMYGIISEALDMEARGEGHFSDNAVKLHTDPDTGLPLDITDPKLKLLFEKGFSAIEQYSNVSHIYPKYNNKKQPLLEAPLCDAVVN